MKIISGKLVVLGHPGVGKTSTVTRYVENYFNHQITPTVGASFVVCNVTVYNYIVKLQIWDTAGQERFKAMAPMFYRNANAALLVFDITARKSFESMKNWITELKRNIDDPIVLCVVGNKVDLIKDRTVTRDEAIQYSKSIGATYHECSAMQDQGIQMVFDDIAIGLLRLFGQTLPSNNQKYNPESIEDIMAKSCTLEATDVGNEETVNLSITSIAHGNSVRKCCY